jgi:uncharacterized protein (TIGR02145 family)
MKKYSLYISSCIIVLAALFLPGCNSEETLIDNNNGGVMAEKGKLSFILPTGATQSVTYASVTGEDAEYKMSNIRIYWFSEDDGLLYKRFACGDNTFAGGATESVDGDTLTAAAGAHETVVTISTGEYSGQSRFYIVANINGDGTTNPDMILSDPLRDVRVGVTTYTDFETLLSDALDKDGNGVKLLGTPIPMSVRDDASSGTGGGYVSVNIDPTQPPQSIKATLKRRVARFDVINTAGFSNFEIKSIHVARAQNKGNLHDKSFVDDADAWLPENLCKFEVTQPIIPDTVAFNGPAGSLADFQSGGSLESQKEHLTKAAFYLYPTVIDNDHKKTEIILEGIFDKTTPVLYTLDLSDAGKYPNNELKIEANKVYRIYVHQSIPAKLQFEIFVDDWYEVDTIAAGNKGITVTSWGTLTSSANPALSFDLDNATQATLNAFLYEFSTSAMQPDTLTLITEGTNLTPNTSDPDKQHVTQIEIAGEITSTMPFLQADLDSLKKSKVISTTTLTYGTRYITTHKIVLAPTVAPVNAVLKVKNAINMGDAKLINIRSNNYNRTGYKAVPFKWNDGGTERYLLWAPVNVGADSLAMGNVPGDATAMPFVGNTYQWGRNVAFAGYGSITDITSTNTAVDAATAAGLTSFIKRTAQTDDWLNPSNDDLWSGTNAQGPCPDGWRIPTAAECLAMVTAATKSATNYNRSYVFGQANGGGTLYVPRLGYREYDGSFKVHSSSAWASYWTSTISGTTGKTLSMQLNNTANSDRVTQDYGRAMAFYIRAVRDIPAFPATPAIP